MLAACYSCALAAFLSPIAEELMTRLRAVLLVAVSAPLGAVATLAWKVMDARGSVLALAGGSALLGVALVVDYVDFVRRYRTDLLAVKVELRDAIERVDARLDTIEAKLVGIGRQSVSGSGSADRTGPNPALR